MKHYLRLISFIFMFCFGTLFCYAQPGDPGGDPDVPIDGGASILLVAGALFGAKKLYDVSKKEK